MDRMNMNDRVRLGFKHQDEQYHKKYDNASADPEIQIFDNDTDDGEESVQYFCAMCKSKLDYHKYIDIWICSERFQQYDPKIQDRPITNNREFKIRPHHEIDRYAKFDNQDPDIPYMKGINLDEREDPDIELVRSSQDQRIKHYRIRDTCTTEEANNKTRDL